MGAVGLAHLVSVVNKSIEWHTKAGVQQNSQSLTSFFLALSTSGLPFDPKVIYDQHAGRFVVVALERVEVSAGTDPSNISRILLAVSDDADPNGTWNFHAIDSKNTITGVDYWADYPGLAVDDKAIYITANLFAHVSRGFGGNRLWIVDKGLLGGLYAGLPGSHAQYDPASLTSGFAGTMQPAHVFGAPPSNVGTFLVMSNITDGTDEFLQVIRVDDPVGTPSFIRQLVNVGNIDDHSTGLPDAPQLGTTTTIEVNDRRALNAVWRNNQLYASSTIIPNSGPDLGQTTAHWWRVDTSNLNALAVADQGNVGGEDIATGTYTFFPSIAVDRDGNMAIGFSASAPTIFPGAYYTGRLAGEPAGTVQASRVVRAGVDYYIRKFGGASNRWGDYSGASVDPVDDSTFCLFNEYALNRGTIIQGEDGRWGTAFACFGFTAPGVPPGVTASAGDGQATISWFVPADEGGSTITGYKVISNPPSPNSPLTVGNLLTTPMTGLTNGTPYTFTVSAINAIGEGPQSDPSNAVTPTPTPPTGPALATGVVSGVDNNGWTTVNLPSTYNSMVVAATPNYSLTSPPLVVRIQNASGSSFQVRADRADGLLGSVTGVDVYYIVVEEGVYNIAEHGVKMEAVKFTSTLTDRKNAWTGQPQSYANSYSSPVVIGQVMTYNDSNFSAFWSSGGSQWIPPSSSTLFVGKHVGEDPVTARANETIGYIVIDAGSGTVGSLDYVAALGTDTVQGVGTSPPYTYSFSGLDNPSSAVLSQAAMDGGDGGWAVLYGPNPLTAGSLNLAIDEDQIGDPDRWHTDEQVAFIVFGPAPTGPTAPGAPTGVTATAGDGQASIAWNAPDHDGGSPVTGYLVTSNPPSPNSPLTVGNLLTTPMTGLTNGTPYTFTVSAINAIGEGPQSDPSNAVTPTPTPPTGPALATGVVSGVDNNGWTTVNLPSTYNSMVVAATPNYSLTSPPLVVRIQNASGSSFQVRADRADGLLGSVTGVDVYYIVVEEGVYNIAEHGVKMEAVKFTSTLTDRKNAWTGQPQSYANSYSSPVVIGQVMTYNDSNFSAFWSSGGSQWIPPSSSTLFVGKHVGEDPVTARANETIGYIVIDAGSGTVGSLDYVAALGTDTVQGVGTSPPYTYSFSGLDNPSSAVLSQAAMDGGDGGWAVLYGPNPLTAGSLNLAIDEDQIGDPDRWHTDEQVAFIVFGPANSDA